MTRRNRTVPWVVRAGFLALVCGLAIIALSGIAGAVESTDTEVVAPAEDAVSEAVSEEAEVSVDVSEAEAEVAVDASVAEAEVAVDASDTEAGVAVDASVVEAEVAVDASDTEAGVAVDASVAEAGVAVDASGVQAGVASEVADGDLSVSASGTQAQILIAGTSAQVSVFGGGGLPDSGAVAGTAFPEAAGGTEAATELLLASIPGDDASSSQVQRVSFGGPKTGTIAGPPAPHAFVESGSIPSEILPMLDSSSADGASIGGRTIDEPVPSLPAVPVTTYPGMSSVSGGSSSEGQPDPLLLATSLMLVATGLLWRTRARCRSLRSRSVAPQPLPG